MAIRRKVLPPGHLHTAYTLVSLGQFLIGRGQFEEALPFLQEAVTIRRKSLPRANWQIAEAENALGACFAGLRRYADAEPLLVASHETLRSLRGASASETRKASRRLADFRLRSGR